jgi:hypothetical protein
MLRQLAPQLRQAGAQSPDYSDFLLSLTEIELEGRSENRRKRRLREARFPLLKTLETFDYQAAPGLPASAASTGLYIGRHRYIIFPDKSGNGGKSVPRKRIRVPASTNPRNGGLTVSLILNKIINSAGFLQIPSSFMRSLR